MKGMRSEGLRGSILFAIFFAAILLTMAGPSTAQTVTFADANLEAQVRAKLAIAAGTPITVADMLNLSELSASAKGIVSIQGMESAVNLNKQIGRASCRVRV